MLIIERATERDLDEVKKLYDELNIYLDNHEN